MPMGKYKDFKSCVEAKMKEGMNRESAEKYCGKIYHATHEEDVYGKLEKLHAEINLLYRKLDLAVEEATQDLRIKILEKDIEIKEAYIKMIEMELAKRATE